MDELKAILNEVRDDIDYDSSESLMEDEFDSLDLFQVITLLSDYYGISFTAEEIIPENFNSITSIMNLIKKKREYKKDEDIIEM